MRIYIITILLFVIYSSWAQKHPSLTLTKQGVTFIQSNIGKAPLFDLSVKQAKHQVDQEIKQGIAVPIPQDLAGGYTHERHKANFFAMQKAGVLFQITKEERYAIYIRDMLLKYVEMWPKIDKHPVEKSYARGKLFWQCLNDANWLVYTAQAYDCIYDWLDQKTIRKLNQELFRPYAEYISIENPQFFNRIHNHSTWGNAAVGMIGLVMEDEELVNWALYGLDLKTTNHNAEDNDGGAIKLKGQKTAGFITQIDHSFSPDGYYTEGPYYQRYAMYPFLIFAQALANKKPELKIMSYRNGLLLKAVEALIHQTNAQGEFFPINDAQKGMSLNARELVNAVSMAYFYGDKDPKFLSVVKNQGKVPLNDSGMATAKAIAEGMIKPYHYKSIQLADGADGDEGAIGILREEDITLVMKYAKHGMGHGHFDRLGFLLYDETGEVIQDYGSARWVNIEHKDGGGYLKENKSWAKQTIAHNTLTVNKKSQFGGSVRKADKTSGSPYYFASDSAVKVVSAKELNAYQGIAMHRTMAILNIEELEKPLIIDLFSVQAPEGSSYELPIYYMGELMSTSQKIDMNTQLTPMGEKSGYQHLWVEGQAELNEGAFSMTWFNKKRFYTITSTAEVGDQVLWTRIGANDPNFNLRRDPGIIHHRTGGNTLFASIYEIHGSYHYSTERPLNPFTSISDFKILHQSEKYIALQIKLKTGEQYQFLFSLADDQTSSTHSIQAGNTHLTWTGILNFRKIND